MCINILSCISERIKNGRNKLFKTNLYNTLTTVFFDERGMDLLLLLFRDDEEYKKGRERPEFDPFV